jgi:hypothetical protein
MNNATRHIRRILCCGLVAVAATGCSLLQPERTGQAAGKEYTLTLRNTLANERLAPVLIVGDADDQKIWVGRYVSPEARTQFTTGNPGPLAATLGGDQGQPGTVTFERFDIGDDEKRFSVLLVGPAGSVTFK